MSKITIVLDVAFDFSSAGIEAGIREMDEFVAAYRQAAARIGEEHAMEVRVIEAEYDSADAQVQTRTDVDEEGHSLEWRIWQAAHDAVQRDQHGRWIDTGAQ